MLADKSYLDELHILDNKRSPKLKEAFSKNAKDFQLVPPAEHCANSSELSIRTFKNHSHLLGCVLTLSRLQGCHYSSMLHFTLTTTRKLLSCQNSW